MTQDTFLKKKRVYAKGKENDYAATNNNQYKK